VINGTVECAEGNGLILEREGKKECEAFVCLYVFGILVAKLHNSLANV
jgi:hypothetical protein